MADEQRRFVERIDRDARRKKRKRDERRSGIWFAVGTFGIVGWSIAIPTVLGLALGLWLDRHLEDEFSWTVALLLGGVTLGCINAWYWVSQHQAKLGVRENDDD
jgi:ATP synthase protein I